MLRKNFFVQACKLSTDELHEMVAKDPEILTQRDEENFTLLKRMAAVAAYRTNEAHREMYNKYCAKNLEFLLSQNPSDELIYEAFEFAIGDGTKLTLNEKLVEVLLKAKRIPEELQRKYLAKIASVLALENPNPGVVHQNRYTCQLEVMYSFLKYNPGLLNDLKFNGDSLLLAFIKGRDKARASHADYIDGLSRLIDWHTPPNYSSVDEGNREYKAIVDAAFASDAKLAKNIILNYIKQNELNIFDAWHDQDQRLMRFFLKQDEELFEQAVYNLEGKLALNECDKIGNTLPMLMVANKCCR